MTMRALCAHPQILGRSLFPYETRFRQYLHAASLNGHLPPTGLPELHRRNTYVPFLPSDAESNQWLAEQATPDSDPHTLARHYYSHIAALQNAASPAYIIEKAVGTSLTTEMLDRYPDYRALFLFRDPRDTYLSIKAFNAQRNTQGFGAGAGNESVLRSIFSATNIYNRLRRKFGDRIHSAHYESLSQGDRATYLELLEWLQLDTSPASLDAVIAASSTRDRNSQRHSTTSSVDDSIGRWKRDSSEEDLKLFSKYHKDISRCGYTS